MTFVTHGRIAFTSSEWAPYPTLLPCLTTRTSSMAKGGNKDSKRVSNKHLHARVAYLHRAAEYLTRQSSSQERGSEGNTSEPGNVENVVSQTVNDHAITKPRTGGVPLRLTSHLRAVSLKSQVRLSQDMKRSFCKVCNSHLLPGSTSETRTENLSKNGKKPWADVLVIKCTFCRAERRFPFRAQKQRSKSERLSDDKLPTRPKGGPSRPKDVDMPDAGSAVQQL